MEVNPISIAYFPGILQGLILLVAINLKPARRHLSSRLLTTIIIVITLLLTHHGLILNDIRLPLGFTGLAAALWFAIPPLLYLYIKSLLQSDFRLRPWHSILFAIPIYNILQWILHRAGVYYGLYRLFPDFDSYVYAWIMNYLLTTAAFSVASLLDLRRAKLHKRHLSKIRWLKWYLIAFIAVLAASVALLLFVISAQQYSDDFEFSLLIVYEVFVLVLVFKSLYFSNYMTDIANDKYRHAPQKNGDLKRVSAQLAAFMEAEKPWLDKQLGLGALSKASGIPENTLSQIFNQHFKTNFYDFVNGYRLQALEKMILDPANRQYKIASLAEECGFSSKTSFYKAFKQKHQMTPTEFMRQHG